MSAYSKGSDFCFSRLRFGGEELVVAVAAVVVVVVVLIVVSAADSDSDADVGLEDLGALGVFGVLGVLVLEDSVWVPFVAAVPFGVGGACCSTYE